MKDRVTKILAPEGVELIKEAEAKGLPRDYVVRKLISNKEMPIEEVLLEGCNEKDNQAITSGRMDAYKNVLVKAIVTGICLKEDIAAQKAKLTNDVEVV